MTPTEKHRVPIAVMDAAEAADTKCQRDTCPRMDCNGFLCVRALEAVYRAAEREGMKRAAEILTEYAGENGPLNEFDDDGYWRETAALTAAAAILSEAGESE